MYLLVSKNTTYIDIYASTMQLKQMGFNPNMNI